jgi:hypothetical protein
MAILIRTTILTVVGIMALTGIAVARGDPPTNGTLFGATRLPRQVDDEIEVIEGSTRLLRLPGEPTDVRVANAPICDYTRLGKEGQWIEVLVQGRSVGRTDIRGWYIDPTDHDRPVIFRVRVIVLPDRRRVPAD